MKNNSGNMHTNIKAYLGKKGIKQTFLARKIGMKQMNLNRVLNGHTNLLAEDLIKICQALEVDVSEFATYDRSL